MQTQRFKQLTRLGVFASVLFVVAGCAELYESKDYIRHTNSTLLDGIDGSDMLQFQAKAGSEFPENDPNAEALRISWLEAWLRQLKKCQDGYTVIKRRPFGFAEYNPAGYDLVYELQCKVALPAGVAAAAGDSEAS
jgi:hypothetical protein